MMENSERSARTRDAVLKAALTIIERDGAGRMTLDAIAKEGGISKGGLTHQFRTKEAVLAALLDHHIDYAEDLRRRYLVDHSDVSQPALGAQIAISREVLANPQAIAYAILAVLALEPALFERTRGPDAREFEAIKAGSSDPDMSVIRWMAARGMAFTTVMGLCPVPREECDRLMDKLLDESQWPPAVPHTKTPIETEAPEERV